MRSRIDQHEILLEIVSDYGTPTYVYDSRVVETKVDEIRTAVHGLSCKVLYALKANALPEILQMMRGCGIGVDVVSPAELELVLRLGFSPMDILFSANNMTNAEMASAVEAGVRINIGELTRMEKYAEQFPGTDICIRINPEHGAGHHKHVVTAGSKSKFGIPLGDIPRAIDIAFRHNVSIRGLHQHIGSGNLDVEPYRRVVPVLFNTAAEIPDVQFVNVGGGFGVAYRPEEDPFDLFGLASVLSEGHDMFTKTTGRALEIWMEPGRLLVAECGALLVEANTLKSSLGRTFVGTDSGMSHLVRPAIYGAYHEVVNLSNPEGPKRVYDVVGNICESSDFFAHDRPIPEVREGDVLAVLDAGAYGMAMASEYNLRPMPAEVFIDAGGSYRCVRRRESNHGLVDRLLRRD